MLKSDENRGSTAGLGRVRHLTRPLGSRRGVSSRHWQRRLHGLLMGAALAVPAGCSWFDRRASFSPSVPRFVGSQTPATGNPVQLSRDAFLREQEGSRGPVEQPARTGPDPAALTGAIVPEPAKRVGTQPASRPESDRPAAVLSPPPRAAVELLPEPRRRGYEELPPPPE
jgi:hypothetical protein